jgi:Ca2+-binding RTX toxin-like protein
MRQNTNIGGARGIGRRAAIVGAVMALPLLAGITPASAATNVSLSFGTLSVVSGSLSDNISVNRDLDGSLIIRNFADTLTAGAPCQVLDALRVRCPANGVTGATVNTGAGNDTVRNNSGLPMLSSLGDGNDTFVGGTARDRVAAGSGGDNLRGGGGDDQLVGGSGVDTADGGTGSDSCSAETETSCES